MTKDEFAKFPMAKAQKSAFASFKAGKISYSQFNDLLRHWWRVNKPDVTLQDLKDVFGGL